MIHSEDDGGDVFYYCFEPRGEVKWLHITAADDWVVVPHVAHRCAAHGVVLKMSGAEQPLPKHILQTKNKSLMTDVDLHRLQKHLGLVPAESPMPNIESLIESLARHYECGAADCLANFMATVEEPNCPTMFRWQKLSSTISTLTIRRSSGTSGRPLKTENLGLPEKG